jgi:hypothetical protein
MKLEEPEQVTAESSEPEPVVERMAPGEGLGNLASAISAITGQPVDFGGTPQRKRRRMARERSDTSAGTRNLAAKLTVVGRFDAGVPHQTWEFDTDRDKITESYVDDDGNMGLVQTYKRGDEALPPIIPAILDHIGQTKTPEVVIPHHSAAILLGLTRDYQTVLQLHKSAQQWGYGLKDQSVRVHMKKKIMTGLFGKFIEQRDTKLAWRVR